MQSRIVRGLVAAAAAPLVLLAGACGDSRSTTAAPTKPVSTALTAKSGQEILAAARDALATAKSVRLKGVIADKGQRITMDLRIGSQTAAGTMKVPVQQKGKPLSAQIKYVKGKLYIRSPQMMRSLGGAQAAGLIGDRWFYSSKDTLAGPFEEFIDLKKFSGVFTAHGGNVLKGATKTINGLPAIALTDSEGGVLYVATTGKPYPLRLAPGTASAEKLDLLEYDAPLAATAPKDAINIDNPKF
jgi:hypothetical protein